MSRSVSTTPSFPRRSGRWLAFAALAVALSRCDSGGDSSDGKSSWLEDCRQDADCTGETSCHCGVCTRGCERASECAGLPSSTCVEIAEDSSTDCRVGVVARSGVCLPSCSGDDGCPGSMRCEAGLCLPSRVAVGSDGGTPPGGKGGAASGGAAGSTGGFDNSGGQNSGGTAGRTTGGSVGNGGSTAPPAGDANAYGGPAEFTSDFGATCTPREVVAAASSRCVTFNQCKLPCQHDNECPAVATGSATPVCGYFGYCQLLCEGGLTCPSGMVCTQQFSGRFCTWQTRDSECGVGAGPCDRRPRPSFCPTGCAERAVACNPALGVDCCEGLTCGPENFCVAGGQ